MSVRVDFYNFSKKEKSTAQPAAAQLVASERCNLKAPTDLLRPTLFLQISNTPTSRTYAHIPEFGRYYFVDKWRSINAGQWECDLIEDYLATWKSAIGSASKYVLRAASASNGNIIDSLYPSMPQRRQLECESSGTQPFSLSNSTFVLGIIGSGGDYQGGSVVNTTLGAVQYYAFKLNQIAALFTAMFDSASWLNIDVTEMTEDLQKAMVNPFQYVASAMMFPFDATDNGTVTSTVNFGWWPLQVTAYKLARFPQHGFSFPAFTIEKHPQAASRGDFLNNAPYSEYYIEAPGFGTQNVDAGLLTGADELRASGVVDLVSGKAIYHGDVYNGSTLLRTLPKQYGQVGVPVELAQIGRDIVSMAAGLASGAVKQLPGQGSKIMNTISSIVDAVAAGYTSVETKGSTGSLADYYYPFNSAKMYLLYNNLVPEDNAEFGRPLCQVVQLSTLSGYIQCADGELNISAIGDERAVLASYLTGGFFYE